MASCVVTKDGELLCLDHNDTSLSSGAPRSLGILAPRQSPLLLNTSDSSNRTVPEVVAPDADNPAAHSCVDPNAVLEDNRHGVTVWIVAAHSIGGGERELRLYGKPEACTAFRAAVAMAGTCCSGGGTNDIAISKPVAAADKTAVADKAAAGSLTTGNCVNACRSGGSGCDEFILEEHLGEQNWQAAGPTGLRSTVPPGLFDKAYLTKAAEVADEDAFVQADDCNGHRHSVPDDGLSTVRPTETSSISNQTTNDTDFLQLQERVAAVRRSISAVLYRAAQDAAPSSKVFAASAAATANAAFATVSALAVLVSAAEKEMVIMGTEAAMEQESVEIAAPEGRTGNKNHGSKRRSSSDFDTSNISSIKADSGFRTTAIFEQCTNLLGCCCGTALLEVHRLVSENNSLRARLRPCNGPAVSVASAAPSVLDGGGTAALTSMQHAWFEAGVRPALVEIIPKHASPLTVQALPSKNLDQQCKPSFMRFCKQGIAEEIRVEVNGTFGHSDSGVRSGWNAELSSAAVTISTATAEKAALTEAEQDDGYCASAAAVTADDNMEVDSASEEVQ